MLFCFGTANDELLLRLIAVDGIVKCEKWIGDDDNDRSEELKANWWLNRLVGRTKKIGIAWPFPFSEEKLFVMTLHAGLEGFHVNVDGRHVTSFPYRTVSRFLLNLCVEFIFPVSKILFDFVGIHT